MGETMPTDNNFGGSSGQSDVTLIVGGHKIPVIKILLSMASPVFKTMFESDFAEKGKTDIELPGKEYKAFVEFLKCLYPDKEENVSEQNVYQILPLADEYQARKLLLSCEKSLLDIVTKQYQTTTSRTSFSKKVYQCIQQAEKYGLKEIKEKCLCLASELSLAEMSCEDFPISEESQAKINRMALKRNELIIQDWAFLLKSDYTSGMKEEVLDAFKDMLRSKNNVYKVARLWYQYFPGARSMKTEIVSCLKSQDRFGEEFDLLPESLKKEVI